MPIIYRHKDKLPVNRKNDGVVESGFRRSAAGRSGLGSDSRGQALRQGIFSRERAWDPGAARASPHCLSHRWISEILSASGARGEAGSAARDALMIWSKAAFVEPALLARAREIAWDRRGVQQARGPGG